MKKFLVLLRKELQELITWQMILPLVITVLLFVFIGNVVGKEQQKAQETQTIGVLDLDKTAASQMVSTVLEQAGLKVSRYTTSLDHVVDKTKEQGGHAVLVIPEGFQQGIKEGTIQPIETYTLISGFSLVGSKSYGTVKLALAALNEHFSNQLLEAKLPGQDLTVLKTPVRTTDHVVVGTQEAIANPDQIMSFVSQQTTFIPIILFFVIIFAAQMIATAIATEKENKTLETLLSLPIKRSSILSAKMVAAAVVALLSSIFYMIGFRSYMNGIVGDATSKATGDISQVAGQLGLVLTPTGYIILGASLFCSILVGLAIAIILGSFAEDVKSLQGLITPLMVLIMIPYLLVLLTDVSTASPAIRYLVYAIPFSHSFLAAPHLFLHEYAAVAWGILYQLVAFFVFLFIATKIFSTDRIVTMKINWGKRRSGVNG